MKSIKNSMKKIFFSNLNISSKDPNKGAFMTKVLSIVIAIVLWMYVIGEVNPETTQDFKNIQVQLVNSDQLLASGLMLINEDQFFVNVKVEGRMSNISSLTSDQIRAIADLRGFSKGDNNVPVEVVLPNSVALKEIKPHQIQVSIDQIIKNTKSVEVQYVGTTAKGYINSAPIISTPEIVISGPETYVNAVDKVVALINLDNASSDITQTVPFTLLDKNGETVPNVETENKDVEITVPILNIKTVPIIVSTVGAPLNGYSLISALPIPTTAQIIGNAIALDNIDSLRANAISLNNLSFTQTIPLNIPLPDGVTLKTSSVPIIKVVIEKIISKKLTYDISEIQFKGLKEDMKVQFLNKENIALTATDVESVINPLSEIDIPVSIDVTGLGYGVYTLQIVLEPNHEYKSLTLDSTTVEITILEDKDTPR